MSLFRELKRRNVIRVALFYIVACWLALQVADVVLPPLGAPEWVIPVLLAVMGIGLVPALVFAWAFELTPEGIKRERDIPPERSMTHHTARKLDIAVIMLLIAVGAMVAIDRFVTTDTAPAAAQDPSAPDDVLAHEANIDRRRSIAVLPFADMSAEGDQAYFADGISEELLNLLARIDDLKVAARTSSFKFRDADLDIAEIGRALNVDTVLEGSVRKAGNQVRITAQLIDVDEGFHLWSDSYDRELDNIFAVQDEIASAIVDALKLELDIAEQTAARTTNIEAYDLYLRARQISQAPSRVDLLRAIDLYQQAIALDPRFAGAYAGIADAWIWLEDYGGFKSAEAFPKAEQAARRALELDPGMAEAHAAMAFVQDRHYNDLGAAQEHFERTLELNPNHVQAYNLYADTLLDMGRLERMVEVARKAAELDPLSIFLRARLAGKLSTVQRYEEAEVIIEAILNEDPDNDYGFEERANIRRDQRHFAQAAADYELVHHARPGDPYPAGWTAIIGLYLGDDATAQRWIGEARARGADNRWELLPRGFRSWARGDWAALEEVGELRGGYVGNAQRGWGLIKQGRAAEARQAFRAALRVSGYAENGRMIAPHLPGLIGLAWLDKAEGLSSWQARSQAAEPFLLELRDKGLLDTDNANVEYQLAQLASLNSDRERALEHLQGALETGFAEDWFLERDPFFEAWRDDPGFQDVVREIKDHAAAEREKLRDTSG